MEKVINTISHLQDLGKWYADEWENWWKEKQKFDRPGVQEVVAYMIDPILLALGWSEKLLAIEWKKIDLAGFSKFPTTKENCTPICEAKHLYTNVLDESVLKQAIDYVKKYQLTHCDK